MSPKEALDMLSAVAWQPLNGTGPAFDVLRAMLLRDWATRVLEAECATPDGCAATIADAIGREYGEVRWRCELQGIGDKSEMRIFHAATADEARARAADAVWPTLPESVRAEIGERP